MARVTFIHPEGKSGEVAKEVTKGAMAGVGELNTAGSIDTAILEASAQTISDEALDTLDAFKDSGILTLDLTKYDHNK